MTGPPPGAASDAPASLGTCTRAVLLFVAYAAIATWWLWPLPAHLTDHAIYPQSPMGEVAADYDLITWAVAWDTHALRTDPARLFDANIFYPARHSLAFSEHFLGYVPLFAPTYLLSGNAVLANNVLIFLTFPLCGIATYALARRFVTRPAAFVAGALFAFSGQRYENLYHVHQLGTFYLPLALLFSERWFERARRWDALGLLVVVALQMLSSFYLAYAMVLLYAAYLPLALWRWRAALDRRRCVGLAVALLGAALPFAAASIPYLELQQLGLVPSADRGELPFTLEPSVAIEWVRVYLTRGAAGPVGYLLALVALLSGWRGGRYPRAIGTVAFAIGFLLAFGPRIPVLGVTVWSPYELLFRWLPGFAAVRLPFRLLILAQLGLCLLCALGLQQILRRTPPRLAWPAALTTLALALSLVPKRPPHQLQLQPTGARLPPVHRWLADHGQGGALLELPLAGVAIAGGRMLSSTSHWLPMIDGYSAYPPLTREYLRRVAEGLPAERALQTLVDLADVKWIIVHLAELRRRERPLWTSGAFRGLEPVGRWGDDLLFAVTLPVSDDRRALLRSTDRTLGGLTLTPVATPCPGRVRLSAFDPRAIFAPAQKMDVAVEVRNASAAPWPGFGLYPRHLVQLRARFLRNGVPIGRSVTTPLWADVQAGAAVSAALAVTVPPIAGDYELGVELVQDGQSLEACGLDGARLAVRVAGLLPPPHPPR